MPEQKPEQKSDRIGALWKKVSKNTGNEYFTGEIEINGEKHGIVMFYNKKTKETQPDFNIIKQKPREEKTEEK